MSETAIKGGFGNPGRLRAVGMVRAVAAPSAAVALTSVLLLALLIVSGLLVWQSYQDAMRRAEASAQTSAQIVAAHTRWIGETSFQALRRVDDVMGARPDVFLAGTVSDLNEAIAALPGGIFVWVFDADGDAVLTNDAHTGPVNVAHAEYFRSLHDGLDWHVSRLVDGPLHQRKVFTIGRRMERAGEFLGAAVMVIPSALLSEFWSSLDLGPESSVSIIRNDGWLVARHPVPEETLDLRKHVLITEHLPRSPSGYYHSPSSPADGVSRIVGYSSVPGLPLIAVAGISQDAALARFWSRTQAAAIVVAPIALALIITSGWVIALLRRDVRQRAEITHALEQNRLLLREVHHRVKNDLQTVTSLVKMYSLPRETKSDLSARIAAMAAVHQQIYETDRFRTLNLTAYVAQLAENLSRSHRDTVQVDCDLAEIEIDSGRAMPLGLIANEVVTNAFKHAFPDLREGRISILLERTGPDRARLEIRDNGIGFDSETSAGMGRSLIEGLSRQIGAEYEFRRDGGTVFALRFAVNS